MRVDERQHQRRGLIGRFLVDVGAGRDERLHDVLPPEDVAGLVVAGKELGHGAAVDGVGRALQGVDGLQLGLEPSQGLELPHQRDDVLRRLLEDDRQLSHLGEWLGDVVEDEQIGRGLDGVEDVVDLLRQRVDVLAVKRRDVGGVQPAQDLASGVVTTRLARLDLSVLGLHVGEVVEHTVVIDHAVLEDLDE